jgi:type II secretory pathway component GspD/PulD (secretin)
MRKRILIGLLAAAVIALVSMILLQPKHGSADWHQQEYLEAANYLAANRFIDRVRRTFSVAPKKLSAADQRHNAAKIEEHRRALAEVGCVVERQFALKYCDVSKLKVPMANTLLTGPGIQRGRFWISTQGDTIVATVPDQVIGHLSVSWRENTIVVTAPQEVIAKCEELIGKADVP